jgi:hypothetical protein
MQPMNSDAEKSRPPTVRSRESTVLAAANNTELTQLSVKCMRQTVVKSIVKSTPTQFWAAHPALSLDAERTTDCASAPHIKPGAFRIARPLSRVLPIKTQKGRVPALVPHGNNNKSFDAFFDPKSSHVRFGTRTVRTLFSPLGRV